MIWKKKTQQPARRERAQHLRQHVGRDHFTPEPSRGEKSERDRRVQVRAGDIAERVDHREHDESEGERDADMRDRAAGGVVDDDRAGAREDEGEGAEKFRKEFFHEADISDKLRGEKRGIVTTA